MLANQRGSVSKSEQSTGVLYNLHWGRKDTVMMNRRYNDDNDDNVEYVLLENITYHGITFRAWKETVDFIEK